MNAIKCGKCKGTHGSVEAVRSCYGAQGTTITDEKPKSPLAVNEVFVPATEKQMNFLRKLGVERELETGTNKDFLVGLDSVEWSKRTASALISALLARPMLKVEVQGDPVVTAPPVPAGYYAIYMDGTVKFYRVDTPTEGKWAGRTFLSVQASDEFHALRQEVTRHAVLTEVLKQGVQESAARYGQLLGKCGRCNRTLTDETSRALGIGPVCRNMDW